MSLPEDTKNEINKYLFEQEKLKKELVDDAKREVINSLNDPTRELGENEKRLIKKTTKTFNILTLVLAGVTFISIGLIANMYSTVLKTQTEQDFRTAVDDFKKEIKILEDDFEDEIDAHIKDTRSDIEKIVDKYTKSSEELTKKQGEYDVFNKQFEEKQTEAKELVAQLNNSIEKVKQSQEEHKQLENSFNLLLSEAKNSSAELDRYINENQRLIEILEMSNELYVIKNDNGQYFFNLGELYIEWGLGVLDKTGTTEVLFANAFENKDDIGISIMGTDLKDNSFAQIKKLDEQGFVFRIINPEAKSDYIQKTGEYRYMVMGRLKKNIDEQ